MKYAYYPGCTLRASYPHVDMSLKSVFRVLGVELVEIDDWNCCGSTAVENINEAVSLALSARNICLAAKISDTMLTPCTECLLQQRRVLYIMEQYPKVREKVLKVLEKVGLEWKPVKVVHPLEIVVNDIGLDKVKEKVKRDLSGIKVVPYYGCLITRPYGSEHPLYPTSMDELFSALKAEVIDYPLKTKCCGATLTATGDERGLSLVYQLLKDAKKRGGNVIVVPCTVCQFNLEVFQDKISTMYGENVSIPVLYFTQLLGLALGLSESELGIDKLLVPFSISAR